MNDEVFLKKEIKEDRKFEHNPNVIFGFIMTGAAIVCLLCLFLLPLWAFLIACVIVIGGTILFVMTKNESANMTKSSAFIRRDGVLYYIRLGYIINTIPDIRSSDLIFQDLDDAMANARAEENLRETAIIEELRKDEANFSAFLTIILNAPMKQSDDNPPVLVPTLPKYVIEFCEMRDARLEKQDDKWIWISYYNNYTHNQRVTSKYRNVYDIKWQK